MSRDVVMALADGIVALASGMTIRSAATDCARIGAGIAEIYRLAGPTRADVAAGRALYDAAQALSAYLRRPTYMMARRLPDYALQGSVAMQAHAFRDRCCGMALMADFAVTEAGCAPSPGAAPRARI